MSTTRREFLQRLGIALAALAAARCAIPGGSQGDDWDDLRQQWAGLEGLAQDAQDADRGDKTRQRLAAEHRAALDRLVAAGKLDSAVAEDMQAAFDGAAYHVWRANAPITCYEPMIGPEYQVESSSNLAKQAEALLEMSERSNIDNATVAQAQTAIERDIAFLAMPESEKTSLTKAVRDAAGDSLKFPSLTEIDLDIPPESAEAARLLVDLLLDK